MPWTIDYNSGVRQDHRGRKYRILLNSRGRQDIQYIEETNAPAGYTIPTPEPKPPYQRKMITTGLNGERHPVVFKPRRLHVIEARWHRVSKDVSKAVAPNGELAEMQEALWQHLFISPDCGHTWKPIGGLSNDYHVQYHIDEEIT